MSVHNLSVVLTGNNTSLSRTLMASGRQVDTFTKKVESAGRTGASTGKLLKAGLAVGFFAVAAAMAYGIVQAAAFDREMRNVQSITKVTDAELAQMGKTIVGMSTRLPQSAKTLAEGLYQISSSGFAGADALKVLEASAMAASAGLTTTEVSARAIAAVLNAYGLQASDAADVSDVLFQTVNLGVVSFEELAGTIGDVVGTAAAATVEVDELGSAVATMTLSGISAAEAGTSLNRLIQSLIDPSDELAAALNKVGYESGALALQEDDLSVVMEKLRVASGGNIETLLKWFPEIRAARGALALMANEGKNYTRVVGEIEDKEKRAGATRAALNEQMKAVTAQWQLFINKINAGAISMGTLFLPTVMLTLDGLTRLAEGGILAVQAGLEHLNPFIEAMADIWADVVDITKIAGRVIGPLGVLLGQMVGYGVIQALNMLATALSTVTGFLADHPDLIKAAAIVMGGIFLSNVVAAGAASAKTAAQMALMNVQTAPTGIAAGMRILAERAMMLGTGFVGLATTGASVTDNIAKMKGSFKGLGGVLMGPQAAMVLLVAGLAGVAMGHQEAVQKAKALRAELEDDIDWKSPESIVEGAHRISEEMDKLEDRDVSEKGVSGFFNRLAGGAQLAASVLPGVDAKMHEVNVSLNELNDAEKEALQISGILAEKYAVVANRLGTTAGAVEAYIAANDIEPLNMSYDELEAAIKDVQIITEKATPKQVAMADAMTQVSDETANAKDQIDAFKGAIDDLLGVEISWFDAQTKARSAIQDLATSIETNGVTWNVMTEKGQANRDAISAAAQAWMDMADSLADKGDMKGAIEVLKDFEGELRTMLESSGMSKEGIDNLVTSLGFVPGNYEALVTLLGKEEASVALEALVDQLDGVDGIKAEPTVNLIDASGQTRRTVDSWIQYYATNDPTARVYVDDKPAKPTQQALDQWADHYEDSDPTAQALMSILDPKGKYKNLRALADDYRNWNPTTTAHVNSTAAQERINALKANLYTIPRDVFVKVHVDQTAAVSGEGFLGGKSLGQRWGGTVYAAAAGGITPAHVGRGDLIRYAEPETGGEAFIPRLGDPRRSTQVLNEAASWYGYGLVRMATGGIYQAPASRAVAQLGSAPPVTIDLRGAQIIGVNDLETKIENAVTRANQKTATHMRKKASY